MRIYYFWVVLSAEMPVIKTFQRAESDELNLGVLKFGEYFLY